ncbi:fasciclin-like arabinogalactan protein 14 [Malania oleifera]|uniref:fasciclin-like arabinogalactan protein 14 n=1 Tax=Malania oleifera TaxID=397392 RepID=UPI0025AE1D02|nr:fasciclin-like arabinogalactan protein 14 [Malania oleifera]
MMNPKSTLSSCFLLLSFSLLLSPSLAFNITKILNQHPEFSTFNDYLTQTQLAADINSRQTITVLAVDNAGMSALSGKPLDVVKKALSLQVILDYYDIPKIQKLPNKTATLTTLYQTSGQATAQRGFLKLTKLTIDNISFRSANNDSSSTAILSQSVMSQPYNISVLQVGNLIASGGIDGNASANANAAAKAPAAASPKAAKSEASPPSPPPEGDDSADADGPSVSDKSPSPSPAGAVSDSLPEKPAASGAPKASFYVVLHAMLVSSAWLIISMM